MGWDNGPWGDSKKYNASGLAEDGTADPLRLMVAKIAHAAPGLFDREMADRLYIDMKKQGVSPSFKSGGLVGEGSVRGTGCAVRGKGKGRMV